MLLLAWSKRVLVRPIGLDMAEVAGSTNAGGKSTAARVPVKRKKERCANPKVSENSLLAFFLFPTRAAPLH